jgi:hypothetical protein
MWISPSFQDQDFQQPFSIDNKILIFEDRILGWKLDIADQVINGKKRPDGSDVMPPIPHSGYAVLDIVFSYFEMIAKYENGYAQKKDSEKYFKLGVFSVFPNLNQFHIPAKVPGVQGQVVSIVNYVLDVMYDGVRCGLYHSGLTNRRVVLTYVTQEPMSLDLQNMVLIINPHLLVPKLKTNFSNYVSRLKDPNNVDLRKQFEIRFDFDSRS